MKQNVITGRGSIAALGAELKRLGITRALLVTGRHSYIHSGAQQALIANSLGALNDIRFFDFSPNPTYEEAIAGLQCFRTNSCDALVAIGGGSAIDIAKTIRALDPHPGCEKEIITGQLKLTEPLCPMVAIPTTSGTGSEATHFSVIYMDGNKYSVAAKTLLPSSTILDASLTDSLSPYITACTGFDALCQAIESYWAKGATQESREYAAKAIPLLRSNIVDAVNNPSDSQRDAMMLGAHYAGRAINISKTTAPHALSYQITSLLGLPHGHAVALTLGQFFLINEKHLSQKEKKTLTDLNKVYAELYQMLEVNSAETAKEKWYNLMEYCGLTTDYKALGLTEDNGLKIVNGVNIERLSNHPVPIDSDQLAGLFAKKLG